MIQNRSAASGWRGATTITTLASAGSSGKHSGNILRSLASNSCEPRGLAINPVGQNGQRERRDRPPVHPPALVLRHRLDSRLVEACILRRLRHLCRFLEFGRGSPASSSTSLSPWTVGSQSFEVGACRATRRWRAVLAPKLAVLSVLEQPVRLGHSDKMERFIFTVIREAELTSATWDTIWRMFLWSTDVMLGRSRLRKMERCGPRPRRGKCWRKVEVLRHPKQRERQHVLALHSQHRDSRLVVHRSHKPSNSQDARVSGA